MKRRLFSWIAAAAMIFPSLFAEVIVDNPLKDKTNMQKGWWFEKNAGIEFKNDSLSVTMPESKAKTKSHGFAVPLDLKQVAGKRVRISVEIKKDLDIPFQKWMGGKFMLTVRYPGGADYFGPYVGHGNLPWKKYSFIADITQNAISANLFLGIQQGKGTIAFRNLKIETLDTIIDLRKFANMGFVDKVAGDGKGGWSDQGSDNDAAKFVWKGKYEFSGIPFSIISPKNNKGNSIITFASPKFSRGAKKVDIDLSKAPASGKYIYMMHSLCHHSKDTPAGTMTVYGSTGKQQKFDIITGRDINNWWRPTACANASVVAVWQTSAGGQVGAYGSRFTVDANLGKIVRIVIEPDANSTQVWILMAMTISDKEYKVAAAKRFVQKAENGWKVLPVPELPLRIKGSALDLSWLSDGRQVGDQGRVIINRQGHYAFAKDPKKAVRFLSTAEGTPTFWNMWGAIRPTDTCENTQKFVDQLKMQGYNMIRLHFIDAILMGGAPADGKFNPKTLDTLDYLAYLCKKNNIYINWDVMSSRIGYELGHPWAPGYDKFYREYDLREFKTQIYYEQHVRRNWEAGAKELLNHVNPYTKLAWKDDPVLAVAVGFNEQEFAFSTARDFSKYKPRWQKFLKGKYKKIDVLNKAWKTSYAAFDVVPVFSRVELESKTPVGRDAAEFAIYVETEIGIWYRKTLRRLGYKGFITNFNMGKSLRNAIVRKDFDFIAMNSYHCHPSSYFSVGSTIGQGSSIGNAGNLFRGFVSMRQTGKPYHITETCHVFWNQYRYEQSFITGAYASFQGFDGITGFGTQVTVHPLKRASPFSMKDDPIGLSQEFLTALIFRRGDVTPANSRVRLQLDSKEILDSGVSFDGVDSAQSRLALTTGFTIDCDAKVKPAANEVMISRIGGSKLLLHSAFTNVLESNRKAFNPDPVFRQLKEKKLLSADNRSSYEKEVYESSTKELFMDVNKNYMTVNTPRTQGLCGEAGAVAKLADFEVKQITTRGNITATSVDGMQPLNQAKRIVIVYATNILNSNMEFESPDRVALVKQGTLPLLVQTGKFSVTLKNKNAANLKAFALRGDGFRMCELPLKKNGDTIELTVDTAALKCGPAIYFELAEK